MRFPLSMPGFDCAVRAMSVYGVNLITNMLLALQCQLCFMAVLASYASGFLFDHLTHLGRFSSGKAPKARFKSGLRNALHLGTSTVASVRLRRWTVPRVEWVGDCIADGGNLPIETRNGHTTVVCNPTGFSSKDCGRFRA